MKLKLLIGNLLFILICYSPILFSQIIPLGSYFNDNNEMIRIDEDTIAFRFRNNDAFDSYIFDISTYSNRSKRIYLNSIDISSIFAKVTEHDCLSDSTIISVLWFNNEPIVYASVIIDTIMNNNSYFWTKAQTDLEGNIYISNSDFNKNSDNTIQLNINALGFSTKQRFSIQKGKKYVITENPSVKVAFIYRFPTKRKFLQIRNINYNEIKVYDPIKKEWKRFKLFSNSGSLRESLFMPSPMTKGINGMEIDKSKSF